MTETNEHKPMWFSIRSESSSSFPCLNCGKENFATDGVPFVDHHFASCPNCNTKLFLFSFSNREVQVLLDKAPSELVEFLGWTQTKFSEVEFVGLVVSLEELMGVTESIDYQES